MKILLAVITALTLAPSAFAGSVKGYYRSNGTYVQPHQRSAPDGNVYNNWSTKGNTNPYTGKAGTKNPYGNNHTTGGYYGGNSVSDSYED